MLKLATRYYDSKIARFITEDSYRGSASDPLNLNLYTYCHNEPIMYFDPTGHWEEGDEKLSTEAQLKIIELTDAYYNSRTSEERLRIQNAASEIRELDKESNKKRSLITMNEDFYDAIKNEYKKSKGGYIDYKQWENIRKSTNVVKNYKEDIPGKYSEWNKKINGDGINQHQLIKFERE